MRTGITRSSDDYELIIPLGAFTKSLLTKIALVSPTTHPDVHSACVSHQEHTHTYTALVCLTNNHPHVHSSRVSHQQTPTRTQLSCVSPTTHPDVHSSRMSHQQHTQTYTALVCLTNITPRRTQRLCVSPTTHLHVHSSRVSHQ